MSVAVAVALLALLVALFALVALVAVYARLRALEAARAANLSGYGALVGRSAPAAVRPGPGQRMSLVAMLDAGCASCHGVWEALAAGEQDPAVRVVAVVDRAVDFATRPGRRAELLVAPDVRADLFEGYTPTVLAIDARGAVTDRRFVYPDMDLPVLVRELARPHAREVSRA